MSDKSGITIASATNLLLKGGRLIDPGTGVDTIADLLIADGRIVKLGTDLASPPGCQTTDLRGKIVSPGFIDMHVHLREPGFEYKETIETGCRAAAAGGFTAVCCMPNTNPPIDEAAVVRHIRERAAMSAGGIVGVYPIAAATKGREGKELAPMMELAEAGAVGFSDDGAPIDDDEIMRRALEYSTMVGLPIIQHAESRRLTHGGAMNEGLASTSLGLPPMPAVAEELMVARDLALVRFTGGRYHVAHVSTAGTVALIREGKKNGLPVSCEVTPHHFALTEDAVRTYDTNTKMNPPLRTGADVEALKEALRDGTVDVIATDHAPHSFDEKEVEFAAAPFGIVGLETAIGLCVTHLVKDNYLAWPKLIEKLSLAPRRILGLHQPKIMEGEIANLTLIDPDITYTVDASRFQSRSKNSPFHGHRLTGKAIGIVNNGKSAFPV